MDQASSDSAAAMERLCAAYWLPLYAYVRHRGYSPEDAEDLTQEFFCRLLQKNYLAAVDPRKGKFRSFLLAAMNHFLSKEWERARTLKRGGKVTLLSWDRTQAEEWYQDEQAPGRSPEQLYERVWVFALLEKVLGRLRHSSVDTTFALDLLPDDRTFVSADGRWVSIWEVTAANRPFSHTNFTVAFPLESLGELAPEQFVAGTIDPRAVRRSAFAFTPKGKAFLMSDAHGSLVRWDSQSVQPTGTLDTLGSNHWGLAFSPDGRWLAAGAAHGGLTVWDWPATRAVTNFSMPIEFIGTVRFSQRGQFLHAAAANNQGEFKVRLWRTADWTEIPLNESQFAGLSAIAISPDERMLAGGFRDGAVKLFRFPLGKPEAAMEHDHLVSGVYFSRDGRQLISASLDRLVIVWDVAAREKLATLQGPGYIWGAALSPDRGRLATGGHGPANAVILWDLSARQPLLSLPGNGQFFFHIAFSPDENTLVAISMSGTAELWRAPSWEEIEAVESRR